MPGYCEPLPGCGAVPYRMLCALFQSIASGSPEYFYQFAVSYVLTPLLLGFIILRNITYVNREHVILRVHSSCFSRWGWLFCIAHLADLWYSIYVRVGHPSHRGVRAVGLEGRFGSRF